CLTPLRIRLWFRLDRFPARVAGWLVASLPLYFFQFNLIERNIDQRFLTRFDDHIFERVATWLSKLAVVFVLIKRRDIWRRHAQSISAGRQSEYVNAISVAARALPFS